MFCAATCCKFLNCLQKLAATRTPSPLTFNATIQLFNERVRVEDWKLPYHAVNVASKNALCNMTLPAVATTMLR